MELIKEKLAEIKPYEKPYSPPPSGGGLMSSMYNLSRARELVDDVQKDQLILNQFYQNISPYNDIVKKVFNNYGLTTSRLICNTNKNEEDMSKILSEIQENIDNS